jgi:hypothetical protein
LYQKQVGLIILVSQGCNPAFKPSYHFRYVHRFGQNNTTKQHSVYFPKPNTRLEIQYQKRGQMMDPKEEAIQYLSEVIHDLTSTNPDLKNALRKCQHACDLLGWTQQRDWFKTELGGYSNQDQPSHRFISGVASWRLMGGFQERLDRATDAVFHDEEWLIQKETVTSYAFGSLDWILSVSNTGAYELTGEVKDVWPKRGGTPYKVERIAEYPPHTFQQVLKQIEKMVFDFASASYVTVKYQQVIGGIFSYYQNQVDLWLQNISLKNQMDAIQSGLKSSNPADWQQAVLGCRTLLTAVANYLWQDPRETYEHLPGKDGKLKVTSDLPKNRLSAYIHQKGFRQTKEGLFLKEELESWATTMRSLYDWQSKAKSITPTLEEARSVALSTVFIIGEIVIKTDRQPITEYSNPAHPSDYPKTD